MIVNVYTIVSGFMYAEDYDFARGWISFAVNIEHGYMCGL